MKSISIFFQFCYHILGQILFVSYTLLAASLIIIVGIFRLQTWVDRILWTWGKLTFGIHRIQVVNPSGQLPPPGPYICMSNHQSNLDAPFLLSEVSSSLRFVSKMELTFLPIYGIASYLAGNIHVNRKDRGQAISALNQSIQKIKAGKNILVFPEGTRTYDPSILLPFKKGGFLIAIAAQVPIIPIGIEGTGTCWPKKNWIAWSGKVSFAIGEPISTVGLTPEDRDTLIEHVRQSIEKLQKKAAEQLQP